MSPATKARLIPVLKSISDILEKCGGRGGTPGPCPRNKPQSVSSSVSTKPEPKPSKPPKKPKEPKKPVTPKPSENKPESAIDKLRRQALENFIASRNQNKPAEKPPASPKVESKPKPEPKPKEPKKTKPEPTATADGFPDKKQPRKLDKSLETSLDKTDKMTSKQKETMTDYASGAIDYRTINANLRDGKPLTGEHKKDYDALHSAISAAGPLPKGTTVYRGLSLEGKAKDDLVNSFKQSMSSGAPVGMPGITSTSIDPVAAASFSRGGKGAVVFEMKPKSGAYISKLSPFDNMARKAGKSGENEVLLADGKRYRCVGVQDDVTIGQKKPKGWGHTVIQLEEVD